MSYRAAILPSRFWFKRDQKIPCDFCNRKQNLFFLAPCFRNKDNHTISAKFIILCSWCANADKVDQYYIPDADTCKVLTRHFTEISKNIGKQQAELCLLSDYVAKFEQTNQEEKNKLLTKLGKQGRPKCEYCGNKAPKARCGGCFITRYCSQECSEANWKTHKETCKKIAKNSLFLDKIV